VLKGLLSHSAEAICFAGALSGIIIYGLVTKFLRAKRGYLEVPWVILVIIVSFFANRSGLPLLPLGEWASYLACAFLAALGISLLALALKACPLTVVSGRERSVLVTKGPYSYIRHPICLSCVLLAFSAAIGFRSAVGVMLALVALVIVYLHTLFEERGLERRFGSAYSEYKSKVGMFVPKGKSTKGPR